MQASEKKSETLVGWLLALPLAVVLLFFLIPPILMIFIVSFWGATEFSIYPALRFDNHQFLFSSPVTYQVFAKTFLHAGVTWVFTLLIGFAVAFFLAFHVQTLTWQIALFLVRAIPFWTSNIIRMISWIPFLGATASRTRRSWSSGSSTRRSSGCSTRTSR
jgi:putative spermidine/putrescine transport system permease protein